MIYRGQKYGEPVGVWWTTSRDEAVSFAMSRSKSFIVLGFGDNLFTDEWLRQYVMFHRATPNNDLGDWLRIPLDKLREQWRGVRIIEGAILLEST